MWKVIPWLIDAPFYRGRIKRLAGLLASFAIWKKSVDDNWKDEDILSFVNENQKHFHLWGEAVVPQLLSITWFLRPNGIEPRASRLLDAIARGICTNNLTPEGNGLADVVINQTGLSETIQKENFKGRSYTLEGIIHILTRWGWRGILEELWPQFTRIDYVEYKTDKPWEFCHWHTETGKLIVNRPKFPQSWRELQEEADAIDVSYIPNVLLENPSILLLFLIVYPHRFTKDVIKFLDDKFTDL